MNGKILIVFVAVVAMAVVSLLVWFIFFYFFISMCARFGIVLLSLK